MSNYTDSLGLEEITPGDQAGLWGTTTNNNLALIDQAVTGVTPITEFNGVSGTTKILTDFNGAADESRSAVLNITGTATGPNTVIVPNKQKTYLVRNNTGQTVIFQTASPTATYSVLSGNSILIFCDGNNNVFTGIQSPSTGTLTVPGGGTGVTTFGAGGILRSTGGTNNLFAFPTVSLTTEVAGTLPVGKGGTGQTSFTSGALITGNGSGNLGSVAVGTSKQALVSTGAAWAAANVVNSITAGTGVTVSGTTGDIVISSSTPTGVTALTATTGISLSGSTGAIVVGNTGVTSLAVAGSGISISGSTGAVTITGSASGGTVTSVSGTGTVSGLTLSGTVTSSGQLTLGGTLSLSSGQVTSALGYTPYNSTNPAGYVTSSSLSTTLTGYVTSSSLSTTLTGYAQLASSPNFTGGSIWTGTVGNGFTASSNTVSFVIGSSPRVSVNNVNQFFPNTDNTLNLGTGGNRWSTVYASNGTINTSDGNEKQQIQDITVAEKAVGQTLKGLMKSFKFNDAVDKKGENARIHFGVIAQDVKAAFEAQGLDATKYGVFCSDTWYEVNGSAYDTEGNLNTKDSPNAVERTRLGVRYEQLFALIIGAL